MISSSIAGSVRSGLEALLDEPFRFLRGRVGLITNHSAVTPNLTHIVDGLRSIGVGIEALFAPEHGIRGDTVAGKEISSYVDVRTGITVHSLYDNVKKPTPEMLANIDVILFDIQDVGCRFYTYVQTLELAMRAAAEQELPMVILDRPNPITGVVVEGPVLDSRFTSFLGSSPIPVRYGMTIGELAMMLNQEQGIDADLTLIHLDGWRRDMWFEDTGLPWVPPSPAMPSVDTATVYPGFCLFEGTNVSEGRGTYKPFEMVGAPWIDGFKLADELNGVGLIGVRFRPAHFTPNVSKYAGQLCHGVQIHITDRERFRPFAAAITALDIILDLWPDDFAFLPPGDSGQCLFDLLAGTDKIRLDILARRPAPAIVGDWQHRLSDFLSARSRYLVY